MAEVWPGACAWRCTCRRTAGRRRSRTVARASRPLVCCGKSHWPVWLRKNQSLITSLFIYNYRWYITYLTVYFVLFRKIFTKQLYYNIKFLLPRKGCTSLDSIVWMSNNISINYWVQLGLFLHFYGTFSRLVKFVHTFFLPQKSTFKPQPYEAIF